VNLDIVVKVVSPEGTNVVELDTTDGAGGSRLVFWIANTPGKYLVEVRSAHDTASQGSYELEAEEIRPAGVEDNTVIEAQASYLEAEKLRRAGEGNSLQTSVSKYQQSATFWETAEQPAQEAEVLKQKAYVALSRSAHNIAEEAAALHTLGQVYDALGDKQKEREFYNQALLLQLSDDFVPQRADTLNDLGVAYNDLGDA
jgi:tetratricopeptide (TPR) repeat protein